MWIVVFFDLPTNTKQERKVASDFRKDLLRDGFTMFQYSVYMRACTSNESVEVHKSRISAMLPGSGQVSIFSLTDKQYSAIENFTGKAATSMPQTPSQLEMF
nr:CRISPR-associated endonuclease Cas2 [Salinispira pacifica]